MQRISDGLAVPKQKMDVFSGKTTGVGADAGKVTLDLTYVPKDISHIIIPPIFDDAGLLVVGSPYSLTGKTLVIKVYGGKYYKTDTPTAGSNSGGAGADPHTHDLTFTRNFVEWLLWSNTALAAIRVDYTVA